MGRLSVGGGEKKQKKWIKHYSSSHKILLVGEGDFSFAASLADAFGSAINITATSLDYQEEVVRKYSKAATHLNRLKELGCTIIHGVNVHTMTTHPLLNLKLFDFIIFNFPHASLVWREDNILQVSIHQELVKGFLKNGREMLSQNGEVHVTHKTTHPFSWWDIERLAQGVGFSLKEKVKFNIWDYPGYSNKRGYQRDIKRPRSDSIEYMGGYQRDHKRRRLFGSIGYVGGHQLDSMWLLRRYPVTTKRHFDDYFPVGESSTYKFIKTEISYYN